MKNPSSSSNSSSDSTESGDNVVVRRVTFDDNVEVHTYQDPEEIPHNELEVLEAKRTQNLEKYMGA